MRRENERIYQGEVERVEGGRKESRARQLWWEEGQEGKAAREGRKGGGMERVRKGRREGEAASVGLINRLMTRLEVTVMG